MTICIGLLASDGIVIAADAEESDTYFKRPQQKIITYRGNVPLGNNSAPVELACAFTGAGQAGYLDAFFSYAMRDIPVGAAQIELEDFLSEKIRTFHEMHLFPLAHTSRPPEIEVLVGAFCRYQTCMFVSCGSTLRRAFPYAAVGVGAHFASSIIDNLSGLYGRQDISHTELLAAYVIATTKERIEGCGKYTAIVSLFNYEMSEAKDGEPARLVPPPQLMKYVPSDKIQRWEDSFSKHWAPRQFKLIGELIEKELDSGI